MGERKVVKYKRVYEIVLEGKSDMRNYEEGDMPFGMETVNTMLNGVVASINGWGKNRTMTIKVTEDNIG